MTETELDNSSTSESRHNKLRDRIAQTFQGQGYDVKTEVQIGHKRVDVVAANDKELLLMEVVDTHYSGPVDERDLNVEQIVVKLKSPNSAKLFNSSGVKKLCPRCGQPGSGPYARWVRNSRGKRYEPYYYFAHRQGKKIKWCYIGKANKNLLDIKQGFLHLNKPLTENNSVNGFTDKQLSNSQHFSDVGSLKVGEVA